MKATIIISDADYQRIISSKKRVKGSIGMIRPDEFDFRAWAPTPSPTDITPRQVMKTKHGKTMVRPDKVSLNFSVKRGKGLPNPADTLIDETSYAMLFIEDALTNVPENQ